MGKQILLVKDLVEKEVKTNCHEISTISLTGVKPGTRIKCWVQKKKKQTKQKMLGADMKHILRPFINEFSVFNLNAGIARGWDAGLGPWDWRCLRTGAQEVLCEDDWGRVHVGECGAFST
jgi:hypothetical protein